MFRLPRHLRRIATRSRGTSYSLPFVIVVPFYLLVILAIFEVGFLMLAKIGTQYAAHAAARSAVVWRSAMPKTEAELQPRRAAWAALSNFIGGREAELLNAGPIPEEARLAAIEYSRFLQQAIYAVHNKQPEETILERRLLIAAARTEIKIVEVEPTNPHGVIEVTITYRAPLYLPVVSRFIDPDGRSPFEYPLVTTVRFSNEAPESENLKLGIDYRSDLKAGEQP